MMRKNLSMLTIFSSCGLVSSSPLEVKQNEHNNQNSRHGPREFARNVPENGLRFLAPAYLPEDQNCEQFCQQDAEKAWLTWSEVGAIMAAGAGLNFLNETLK